MVLRLITEGEFRSSRYGQLADQIEGRLSTLIEQAESHIEAQLDRVISITEYTERPNVGKTTLFLRNFPIASVVEIKVGDTILDPSAYVIDSRDGTISLNSAPTGPVSVRYTAGYNPIPPVIKSAVILQTAYFAYQDFEIYGSGDGKPPGIVYIKKDIGDMIAPFKRRTLV